MQQNRVGFYGDASLPHYRHDGHFEYGPEIGGVPSYGTVDIPRELWSTKPPPEGRSARDWETVRKYCHDHLLPWVPLRFEEKPCGQSRNEGQGGGVALVRRTASYTVLGCWDYTGDARGYSWSLFWIRGHLSSGEMIAAIARDFPQLWARITKPSGMAISARSDPDPEVAAPIHAQVESYDLSIPDEFFAQNLGEMVALDGVAVDAQKANTSTLTR